MNTLDKRFEEIRPRVVQRTSGGWLAVTPMGAPLTIGVVGATEIEAIAKFRGAITRWQQILTSEDSDC